MFGNIIPKIFEIILYKEKLLDRKEKCYLHSYLDYFQPIKGYKRRKTYLFCARITDVFHLHEKPPLLETISWLS